MLEPGFHLLRRPRQFQAGDYSHPCGRCGVPEALIHSAEIGDDGQVRIIRAETPPLVRYALYCWVCTWLMVEGR